MKLIALRREALERIAAKGAGVTAYPAEPVKIESPPI